MKKIIACIPMIVLLLSCTNDLFDELDRNLILPAVSMPAVSSFVVENQVLVDWEADAGADSYRLYRDYTAGGAFTTIIYEGSGLAFTDDDVADGIRYYYKLSKLKGLKEFDKSAAVMGVGSAVIRDRFEGNDTKTEAAEFVNTIDANIYFYRDSSGNALEDRDWYRVDIGPRQYMTIRITLVSNLSDGDITFGLEEAGPVGIISNNTYEIHNTDYTAGRFYFAIAVDKDAYLGGSGATGGRLGFYRIQFVQINNTGL
jgi:hypothetical protein